MKQQHHLTPASNLWGKNLDELEQQTEIVRHETNLRLLRRADPDIVDVIKRATFVAAYVLDEVNQTWARAEIEGAFYLVMRSVEPKYRLIILNQRNPQNLVEEITPAWEISAEENYVFYRVPVDPRATISNSNPRGRRVAGLWFSDASEKREVQNAINAILDELLRNRKASGLEESKGEKTEVAESRAEDSRKLNVFRKMNKKSSGDSSQAKRKEVYGVGSVDGRLQEEHIDPSNCFSSNINTNHMPNTKEPAIMSPGATILSLLGVVKRSSNSDETREEKKQHKFEGRENITVDSGFRGKRMIDGILAEADVGITECLLANNGMTRFQTESEKPVYLAAGRPAENIDSRNLAVMGDTEGNHRSFNSWHSKPNLIISNDNCSEVPKASFPMLIPNVTPGVLLKKRSEGIPTPQENEISLDLDESGKSQIVSVDKQFSGKKKSKIRQQKQKLKIATTAEIESQIQQTHKYDTPKPMRNQWKIGQTKPQKQENGDIQPQECFKVEGKGNKNDCELDQYEPIEKQLKEILESSVSLDEARLEKNRRMRIIADEDKKYNNQSCSSKGDFKGDDRKQELVKLNGKEFSSNPSFEISRQRLLSFLSKLNATPNDAENNVTKNEDFNYYATDGVAQMPLHQHGDRFNDLDIRYDDADQFLSHYNKTEGDRKFCDVSLLNETPFDSFISSYANQSKITKISPISSCVSNIRNENVCTASGLASSSHQEFQRVKERRAPRMDRHPYVMFQRYKQNLLETATCGFSDCSKSSVKNILNCLDDREFETDGWITGTPPTADVDNNRSSFYDSLKEDWKS